MNKFRGDKMGNMSVPYVPGSTYYNPSRKYT